MCKRKVKNCEKVAAEDANNPADLRIVINIRPKKANKTLEQMLEGPDANRARLGETCVRGKLKTAKRRRRKTKIVPRTYQ